MPSKTADRAPETRGRPTLYKGIRMRSRLEARYAAWLDERDASWEYEPECFAGPEGQWLPDFRFGAGRDRQHYVELKPHSLLDFRPGEQPGERHGRIDAILARMMTAWHSEPEARLSLAFFNYEQGEPDTEISAMMRSPWFVIVPSSSLWQALWPGMGQWAALPVANPHMAQGVTADGR